MTLSLCSTFKLSKSVEKWPSKRKIANMCSIYLMPKCLKKASPRLSELTWALSDAFSMPEMLANPRRGLRALADTTRRGRKSSWINWSPKFMRIPLSAWTGMPSPSMCPSLPSRGLWKKILGFTPFLGLAGTFWRTPWRRNDFWGAKRSLATYVIMGPL